MKKFEHLDGAIHFNSKCLKLKEANLTKDDEIIEIDEFAHFGLPYDTPYEIRLNDKRTKAVVKIPYFDYKTDSTRDVELTLTVNKPNDWHNLLYSKTDWKAVFKGIYKRRVSRKRAIELVFRRDFALFICIVYVFIKDHRKQLRHLFKKFGKSTHEILLTILADAYDNIETLLLPHDLQEISRYLAIRHNMEGLGNIKTVDEFNQYFKKRLKGYKQASSLESIFKQLRQLVKGFDRRFPADRTILPIYDRDSLLFNNDVNYIKKIIKQGKQIFKKIAISYNSRFVYTEKIVLDHIIDTLLALNINYVSPCVSCIFQASAYYVEKLIEKINQST